MSELTVTGLHKSYGAVPVLVGLDLTAEVGSLTAVLGPSGSGKTTLLRVMAGFERSDAGQVSIAGECVDGGDRWVVPEKRRVGYVPQEGCLFPHLSVAANIGFGLPRGARGRDRNRRVDELLELIGLKGMGERRPHELSGGQQQRVALARALAPRPRIVLLDEPFASLDTGLRASLRDDVRQVLTAEGTTTVLVTHDQDEALSIADAVAVMRLGRIIQTGTPRELYDAPADAEVATFVGMANLVPGVVDESYAATSLGELCLDCPGRVPAGGATILIRPEQLAIRPAEGCPPDCPRAAVCRVDYHGHEAVVRLQLRTGPPGPDLVARVPAGPAGAGARPGDVVGVTVRGGVHAWAQPEGDLAATATAPGSNLAPARTATAPGSNGLPPAPHGPEPATNGTAPAANGSGPPPRDPAAPPERESRAGSGGNQ